MSSATVILSMLHEGPEANSATRLFRGEAVLRWTLRRLAQARRVGSISILCWEDQLDAVAPLAVKADAFVLAKGPRVLIPEIQSVSAARRWSDGWRGGLLSTCDFDAGFYAPWALELSSRMESNAIVLVDPASALVDPALLDGLIDHADAHCDTPICFLPAAPGLGGALLRRSLLEQLASAKTHPGRLLHYLPDQSCREPLAGDGCAPVPTPAARTTHYFKLDSSRQIERISAATTSLNGELIASPAEQVVRRMDALRQVDSMPREVVLELNTSRSTRPIFWGGSHVDIRRPDLSLELADRLLDELGTNDSTRLTLAGIGDPLRHEQIFEVIDRAKSKGSICIHLETDLLDVPPDGVGRLARAPIDILSVHLPALRPSTYEQVMGREGYEKVLENIRLFMSARKNGGIPILVPTFVKCRANQGEMEAWYDQWLRAVGSAVIRGPGNAGGLMPDISVADMSPPQRRPCNRLLSRITVLSDGRIVSCEEDVFGRQAVGQIGKDSLSDVWRSRMNTMRSNHQRADLKELPVCGACKEWHRP